MNTETGSVCWRCQRAGNTSVSQALGLYDANEPAAGTFIVTQPSGAIRRETICADHVRGYRSAGWKVEAV